MIVHKNPFFEIKLNNNYYSYNPKNREVIILPIVDKNKILLIKAKRKLLQVEKYLNLVKKSSEIFILNAPPPVLIPNIDTVTVAGPILCNGDFTNIVINYLKGGKSISLYLFTELFVLWVPFILFSKT